MSDKEKFEIAEEQPPKGPVEFEAYLDEVREKPADPVEADIEEATGTVSTINDAYLLSTGPQAFENIEGQIKVAKKSIKINIFSWANDSTGERISDVLVEVKKKNPSLEIEVRIDKLGAMLVGSKEELKQKLSNPLSLLILGSKFMNYTHLSRSKLEGLRDDPSTIYDFSPEEKADLEAFVKEVLTPELLLEINPALKRLKDNGVDLVIEDNGLAGMDHSKLFIFDDKFTYSGGMNVGDDYSGGYERGHGWTAKVNPDYWKDYMVFLDGPAANIGRHHFFGKTQFTVEKRSLGSDADAIRVLYNASGEVAAGDPEKEKSRKKQITYATYRLIDTAKNEIQIEHAYIMDSETVKKLKAAAKRGVKITILRSQPESKGLEAINARFFRELEGVSNINIYRYPRVTHTKLISVDGKRSIIGSANLSKASLHHHEELSFMVTGDTPFQKEIQAQLKKSVEYAKKREAILHASNKRLDVMRPG